MKRFTISKLRNFIEQTEEINYLSVLAIFHASRFRTVGIVGCCLLKKELSKIARKFDGRIQHGSAVDVLSLLPSIIVNPLQLHPN